MGDGEPVSMDLKVGGEVAGPEHQFKAADGCDSLPVHDASSASGACCSWTQGRSS